MNSKILKYWLKINVKCIRRLNDSDRNRYLRCNLYKCILDYLEKYSSSISTSLLVSYGEQLIDIIGKEVNPECIGCHHFQFGTSILSVCPHYSFGSFSDERICRGFVKPGDFCE